MKMAEPDLELDSSARPSISPFELLSVLWRRKLIVAVVLVVSVVVSVGLSLRAPKEYASSAQLLFREPSFAQALFGSNLFQSGQEEPLRTTQTNIDVVSSLNVAEEAQRLLHTHEPPDSLLNSISVTPSSNANVATLKAKGSSPASAATLANAFAEGYILYRRQTDRATVAQAEELVSQSLTTASAAARPKLEESLRQLGVLKALQTGNAEIIEHARPESTPIEPRPKRGALVGALVGLLLGCGLALLVDRLDQRLRTLEDIKREYGYSVIASIPHTSIRGGSLGGGSSVAQQAAGEAYRMLREGLRFLDPSGLAKCFVVTSAEESEGKSTVAVNLASALAAIGQHVVLLEADMRRPTAAAKLGVLRNALGLSDLLVSHVDLESCIVSTDEPNLAILPSGWNPPNPADLLSAKEMADVMTRLRDSADIVIVDSPPLLPVADTRVLLQMPEIDGVILVGRAGKSRRDRVRTARQVLEQSGRRVFGLVVTDVSGSLGGSYSYNYNYKASDEDDDADVRRSLGNARQTPTPASSSHMRKPS
jgi:succinoglycan biosynthesis transport protein ExoP